MRQAIRLQLAVGYGLGWLSQQLNAATGDDPSVRYASVDDGPSLVRGQPRREEARKGDEFLKGGGFPMVAEGGGRRPQFLVVRCNGWAVSSGAAVLRRYLGWRWRGPQGTAAGCNSDGMKCHTANGTRFVLVVTLGMTDRMVRVVRSAVMPGRDLCGAVVPGQRGRCANAVSGRKELGQRACTAVLCSVPWVDWRVSDRTGVCSGGRAKVSISVSLPFSTSSRVVRGSWTEESGGWRSG